MGSCEITNYLATGKLEDASYKADEQMTDLLKPLKGNRDASELSRLLVGFQDMVYKLKGSDALDIINNGSVKEVGSDMNYFVNLYTNGSYKDLKSLIESVGSNTPNAMEHLKVVGHKALSVMERLAAYRTDFSSGEQDKTYSDFMRLYGNFLRQNQLTSRGAAILGADWMKKMNVALANFGPLVAKDNDLFELDTMFTGINSAIKTNNNHVKQLIDQAYKDHNLKGYVKSSDLNSFMNKSNGLDYNKSRTYADSIANDILVNHNMNDSESIKLKDEIVNRLINFKKAYNKINYGADMESMERFIDAYKTTNPNYTDDDISVKRVEFLTNDKNITFMRTADGEPVAPIFWMQWKQGTRIRDVIAKKLSAKLPLIEIEQKFYDAFDPSKPDYKPRTYYSPSKLDDFFDLTKLTNDDSSGITHYPSFFKSKKSTSMGEDSLVDVQALTHENGRKFQYTMEKLSKYSIATLQNAIIESRYANNQVNPDMDKAYKLVKHRNNENLEALKPDSINKQYATEVMYAKQFASAYQCLIAGTILTKSAINNYLGGLVSVTSSLGLTEGWKVVSNYRQAARSNNDVERHTRALVDKHLAFLNPVSTKSEMILKDIEKDADGKLDYAFNTLTNAMQKTGDFFMTKGLLGWIPGFKFLAFNRSEENISKMYNAILYDKVNTYMKSRFEGEGSEPMLNERGKPSDAFNNAFKEALSLFESDARRKGYQAVGQYDDNAKPLMFNAVKDADTVFKVIAGTFTSTMFMFKMVEHNNMNLLNRLVSVYSNGKNLNFKELSKQMMSKNTPASMGVGLGLMVVAFYEWLADEYEFLPQVFNAYNATPTKLPKDAALAAGGLFSILTGSEVSPAFQNGMIDIVKFAGGPVGGGLGSEAMMSWFSKSHPLAPYIERWSRSMNIEDSWGSMMMKSFIPSNNLQDMYKYQTQLKLSRGKTVGLIADSESGINIGAIPFVNVTPLGSSTGLAKLAQDLALITNSTINAFALDNPNDSRKAASNIASSSWQFAKDIMSISLYVPDKSIEYNRYYDDYNEWKVSRMQWEYDYHGKPQTAQIYRTAQQQMNRFAKMPYIERPAYNQGDWKYRGQPIKAQMIANKNTGSSNYQNNR